MQNTRPKKGYGYIYMYTSPSGKSYIGQTTKSLFERAGGKRGKGYKRCPIFYRAIKKYGFDAFDANILAEIPVNQLNTAECKYILLFNTRIPYGYNIDEGGTKNILKSTKKIYQYDACTGQFLKEYCSVHDAAVQNHLSISSLAACARGENTHCGGYCQTYQYVPKYPINETVVNSIHKEVRMYDFNNNLLCTFPSITRAALYVHGDRSAIKKACCGKNHTAYGYTWRCDMLTYINKYNNSAKKILMLDKTNNNILKIFPSISAAARSMNKSTTLIRRALDSDTHTAYGYRQKIAHGSTTIDA